MTASKVTVTPASPGVADSPCGTSGAVLSTVTATAADTPTLPAPSVARATRAWPPSATVVVSQAMVAGAPAAEPAGTPSTKSSTRVTEPWSSAALMATPSVSFRRAPGAGAPTATVGGVVSTGGALTHRLVANFWISVASNALRAREKLCR